MFFNELTIKSKYYTQSCIMIYEFFSAIENGLMRNADLIVIQYFLRMYLKVPLLCLYCMHVTQYFLLNIRLVTCKKMFQFRLQNGFLQCFADKLS